MEVTYRPDLPPLPARMSKLPLDARGYPVPWFVAFIDGKPDFRIIRENGLSLAHNNKRCWLCGGSMGVHKAFLIGPMCGINRTIAEPPSHRECAEYAVKACPFLTRPLAVRNERDLGDHQMPAGEMIKRNPGVTLLWVTKEYRPFRAGNGWLFRLGEPTHLSFWREGRAATRPEIDESITTGIPLLMEPAQAEGVAAVRALARMWHEFEARLPPMVAPT
jgi:hypothetical protein